MSNLTEVSITARKSLIYLALILISIFVLKGLYSLTITYIRSHKVTKLPPPNYKFGKLPRPVFPAGLPGTEGYNLVLENIEGSPPETTTAGKVYLMPKKLPTLLSVDRAKQFAAHFGFTKEPLALSSTLYLFAHKDQDLKTLQIDTVNMNYQMRVDYTNDRTDYFYNSISSKEKALGNVNTYLASNNLFDSSLFKSTPGIDLLRYQSSPSGFLSATSISTANAMRVNFFRPVVDNLKIVPEGFKQSFIYAIWVPGKSQDNSIIELSYTFWPIAYDEYGTYSLLSGTTAWQRLNNGKGIIINLGDNTKEKIVIRNIYLAYYDSSAPQNYLQPIFVFEGDNEFVAYLPAITEDYLED